MDLVNGRVVGKGWEGREESKRIPKVLNLGNCEDVVAINTSLAERLTRRAVDDNFFILK